MVNPLIKLFKNKICKRCSKSFKPTTGTQVYCFDCIPKQRKEYKKQWFKNNPEKCRRYARKYYYKNLAKTRAIKRKWNNANPDRSKKWPRKTKQIQDGKKNYAREKARKILKSTNRPEECSKCYRYNSLQVHHIDFNPFNNDIKNLCWLCKKCHSFIHRKPI